MKHKTILISLIISVVVISGACSGGSEVAQTQVIIVGSLTPESAPATLIATDQSPDIKPVKTPRPFSPAQGGALITEMNEFFTAAGNCVPCHKNNIDESGNDVSVGEYWRSTMMANAANDPYYLAGVSTNIDRFPEYSAEIESKCSKCHMPMAHISDMFFGEESLIFGTNGYLNTEHNLHKLAMDGVSCTSCHQIQDEELGEFSSFSGGFAIDDTTPMGSRTLFGRFELHQSSQNMMAKSSGFISQKSDHLIQSEICATCHNLYTQFVLEDGIFSDEWFAEQTPYTEWLHSIYATESACQDCHMPPADGSVVLSNMGPGGPRSPYAKHSFVGGNVYMLGIINNYGGEFGVQAGPDNFEATMKRTLSQLQTDTAEIEISEPETDGERISFDVTTSILTGHKFPTGYPSRRAWLRINVKDVDGNVIFESGTVGDDGSIIGNCNDEDGMAFEPHYDEITSAEQVQIYETIIMDVEENLTTILLAASSYIKDNRLLPSGFDKSTASDDIKPYGVAFVDDNFGAGGDTVRYKVDIGNAPGPFSIDVDLLYQSISYRWADDLSIYDTEQAMIFSEYYAASPNDPILIASQSIESD